MLKKTPLFLACVSFIAAYPACHAMAQDANGATASASPVEMSANVGFVSDYIFRGITQSDENVALQGGFDAALPVSSATKLYLGVWGSNVDFNDDDEASIETDIYGGVNHTMGQWNFDGSLIWYGYPSADDSLNYDYWEAQGKVAYSFPFMTATGSINYSPDYWAGSDDAFYYKLDLSAPLPQNFSVGAYIGYQSIDDEAAFGVPDYTDYGASVGYNYQGFDFKLSYIDTDLDHSECADGCDGRAVLGVSRKF